MKKSSLFILPFFLLFLISCSQEVNDLSPVSPNELSKQRSEISETAFPYHYMQSFTSITLKEWSISDNMICAELANYSLDHKQLFVVVQTDNGEQMYFLQRPRNNSVKVPLPTKIETVLDLRFYGMGSSDVPGKFSAASINALENETGYPYAYLQDFPNLSIIESNPADQNALEVYAEEDAKVVVHLFAEIVSKSGNYVVFLQNTDDSHFLIPNVCDDNFADCKLYGLY